MREKFINFFVFKNSEVLIGYVIIKEDVFSYL